MSLSDFDKRSLVARLQKGDSDALHDLSQAYAHELGVIAVSITGSRDLAQEVFQDVLLSVWDQRAALADIIDFTAFLRKITRRRAIDLVRKERSQARISEQLGLQQLSYLDRSENLGAKTIDSEDLRTQILSVLQTVPPRCREIFLMHWEGQMSYAEIADTLDIARETVHKQMSRAMRTLIAHFQGQTR